MSDIYQYKLSKDLIQKLSKIKMLISDVDGVLTDGRLYYGNDGTEMKSFSVLDGYGLKSIQKHNILVAIISARKSSATFRRMQELGIKEIHLGVDNKDSVYDEVLKNNKLTEEQVLYIGDDIPDLNLVKRSAIGVSVPNAVTKLKAEANYITQKAGGAGAVREICDLLIESLDK